MLKVLLLSVLLTAVYSWDEIKYTLMMLVRSLLRRQNNVRFYQGQTDRMVGSLIMVATIPFGLTFFVSSSEEILPKFIWLCGLLLLSSMLATGSTIMLSRLRFANGFSGQEKTFATLYSFLGLASPVFGMFRGNSRQDKKILAKFALYLSLPPLVGVVFKLSTGLSPSVLIPHTDALITLLVASLFIQIGIDFLEKMFKIHKLKTLFSYYRVVLGIVLSAILLVG